MKVSHRIIGEALKREGFSLQANKKRYEGASHPDRDAQFDYINTCVKAYLADHEPVISVDLCELYKKRGVLKRRLFFVNKIFMIKVPGGTCF